MSARFEGQIALVTGASRGLGFQVARQLCNEGARVFALARTQGGLEDLDDLVKSEGGTRPTLIPLDLTDAEGVERLAAAIAERHNRLDLLIHCAAHGSVLSPVVFLEGKELEKSFRINGVATYTLLRTLDRLLKAAPAATAMMMDDSAAGSAFYGTYGAGKAMARALVQSYAAETENAPVSVILHEPPKMPTALRKRHYPGEDDAATTTCADAAAEILDRLAQRA